MRMYVFLTLSYILSLFHIANASTCTSGFLRDESFFDIKMSTGVISTKEDISSNAECASTCSRFGNCLSYFYNPSNKICQLNSVIYLSTEGSVTSPGSLYFKKKLAECPVPPSIPDSSHEFDVNTIQRNEGTQLQYTCDSGHFKVGQVTCQANGQWSTMTCVKVRTCAEVHQCNNSYSDNEYWIYPLAFGETPVKIFCNNMLGEAKEFVSLMVPNVGRFPNVKNYGCAGENEGPCDDHNLPGETNYTKIRVDIQTMEVYRDDFTFANTVFGNTYYYGEARDCYTPHDNGVQADCGPKGTFNIDLTGTGLKVDPSLEFTEYGWKQWSQITRSAEDAKIDLLCGGWPGSCEPSTAMLLKINQHEVLPEDRAVNPTCTNP